MVMCRGLLIDLEAIPEFQQLFVILRNASAGPFR